MKIRAAMIMDNMGTFTKTPDEERDEVLEDLRREGLSIDLVFFGNSPFELPETQIDFLIVDYGALWQMDLGDWSKAVIRWAEEHPGSLVMLWSSFTGEIVYRDWEDLSGGEWPSNLRPLFEGHTYQEKDPLGWRLDMPADGVIRPNSIMLNKWQHGDGKRDWYSESLDFMRNWFGVTEEDRDRAMGINSDLVAPSTERGEK